MARFLLPTLVLAGAWMLAVPAGRADDPQPPQNVPPALAELLKDGPEKFLERYDQNKDGVLTPDEVPPFLKRVFDRFDRNGDGKLDKDELAAAQKLLRQRFGQGGMTNREMVDRLVTRLLEQFDTNKDGKISKEEARGRLADNFDRLDMNKDGFLDKDELRRAAPYFLPGTVGAPAPGDRPARPDERPVNVPDFDALDRDADGRLTRDELKGTPWAEQFEQMDTNKDGKIDRKEFTEFFKKQAAKK
jgi:Ca2+-binding EF-hand superfamily protein